MPTIAIYDWSRVTTPGTLTPEVLRTATHGNDPNTPDYDPNQPSWVNETYTYAGGAPTQIVINDDDDFFEDSYTETGGAQTLKNAVTINGKTFAAGSIVENEFSLVDPSGNEVWIVRIAGENVGFAPAMPYTSIPAGSTFTPTTARDGDPVDSGDGISSMEAYSSIVCFTAGMRIETPGGPVPAGDLERGDRVLTADDGAQPVLWVGRSTHRFDTKDEVNRPVLLPAGCLGPGVPANDLVVSPQHRILLEGDSIASRFDAPEVFAPARGLLPLRGARVMKGLRRVDYIHLLLPRHGVLHSEGARTESFYPGPMAMAALGPRDRQIVTTLAGADYGPLARPAISCRDADRWARAVRDDWHRLPPEKARAGSRPGNRPAA